MEFKRYFAIRDGSKFFRGHMVVAPFQINKLLDYNQQAEVFTAIELYYSPDDIAGSMLVFDIDFADDLQQALDTARLVSSKLNALNITHDCFFSGNKGFHIVVPTIIYGTKAHMMCKAIKLTSFNIAGIDDHIYRERSLLRCEGSINFKSGLYKTKIAIHDTLDNILKLSAIKKTVVINQTTIPNPNITTLINKAIPKYIELTTYKQSDKMSSSFDMPICLRKMWADKDPPRNIWHTSIYTLVKSMYNSGMTQDEITNNFDSHEFWSSISGDGYSRRSYTKIIKSLSNSSKTSIGCKNGLGAEAMKHYCSTLCPIVMDKENIWSTIVEGNSKPTV
jgi:hypothetical protein